MAEVVYLVRVTHKSKGLGYVARDAFRNCQKQRSSPIQKVEFASQPTSNTTDLVVVMNDAPLREIISRAMETSGRIPQKEGAYTLEIMLQREGDALGKTIVGLQKELGSAQEQLTALQEENARLRQDSAKRTEIMTPLDGLFAYFETAIHPAAYIIEDAADLDFARRVFNREAENTLVNYVNHRMGERLTEGDIETILAFDPLTLDATGESKAAYDTAKSEMR